jgi:hypothetical protein
LRFALRTSSEKFFNIYLALGCIPIKRLLNLFKSSCVLFRSHPTLSLSLKESVVKARKLVSPFEKVDEEGFGDAVID